MWRLWLWMWLLESLTSSRTCMSVWLFLMLRYGTLLWLKISSLTSSTDARLTWLVESIVKKLTSMLMQPSLRNKNSNLPMTNFSLRWTTIGACSLIYLLFKTWLLKKRKRSPKRRPQKTKELSGKGVAGTYSLDPSQIGGTKSRKRLKRNSLILLMSKSKPNFDSKLRKKQQSEKRMT